MKHKFVEIIPNQIEDNTLYISIEYCTAVHKCICGCGNEVVTPISPTDWKLSFNGKTVSLYPSIGNWSFECKSHYFITENEIHFARNWDDWEIEKGRQEDKQKKDQFFNKKKSKKKESWWKKLFSFSWLFH